MGIGISGDSFSQKLTQKFIIGQAAHLHGKFTNVMVRTGTLENVHNLGLPQNPIIYLLMHIEPLLLPTRITIIVLDLPVGLLKMLLFHNQVDKRRTLRCIG